MGQSNKERQAAFRERMKTEGRKVLSSVWVTPEEEQRIKSLLAGDSLHVTFAPPPTPTPKKPVPVTDYQLPALPPGMPQNIQRQLQDAAKKIQQDTKRAATLLKNAGGVRDWITKTVLEWQGVQIPGANPLHVTGEQEGTPRPAPAKKRRA